MDYKSIIRDAWILTKQNKKLFWYWAFVPAIFTVMFGILNFVYQVMAFRYSPLMSDTHNSGGFLGVLFEWIYDFVDKNTSIGIVMIVIVAILGLVYFVYPTFCQVSLIQLIARIKNKQNISMIDGITYGALGFLKLFEYHMIIKMFGIITMVTEAMFVLRNFGWDLFEIILIPFVLFSIFALIVKLFLSYTDFYIVIDEENVIKSMAKSMKLVILNWRHTILLLILMLLISVRIVINIILVLLVPSLIFLAAGLLATLTLETVGIVIGALVGIAGLIFAAYLTGVLEIFSNAVWVFTFLDLTDAGEVSARAKGIVQQEEK
ncbi:MAG: hypothetical protein ACD_65C00346G0008 [uncultured bacterium]|nr:MAG: hypothetical protein ACD_65C00346G0008 [uncultured bacterium]KKT02590.1 MAG: hypothetical protein UV80_C0002G0057 [Candidatus Peregrinibacteria bacterium GW2011_GWF2_43_17]HAU39896.1 hypothetical protein [Candidatus Peregrinibacteria bacterium]